MSWVSKRPNGKYRAGYRDTSGREHNRTFAKKGDAQRWLDEVTADMVTGRYADPRMARRKFRLFAAEYEENLVVSAGSARIVDNALRLWILPAFGDTPIGSITTSQVQAFVKRMHTVPRDGAGEPLAAGSVRNVYAVLAKVFAMAVRDKAIPASPCVDVALPREDDEEVVIPTVGQVVALREAMPPRYRAAVTMLAGSGLRIGELLALPREGAVDYLRREVRVTRQRLQSGELAPPKTRKSLRTVPLGQVVLDDQAAHLATFDAAGEWSWLYTREDGKPLDYRTWKRLWTAARTTTGFDISTHDLRHFFASLLIAGGASVKAVQTILGHSTPAITLGIYAHLWPGDEDRARSVADAALGALRTVRGPEGEVRQKPAGQSG